MERIHVDSSSSISLADTSLHVPSPLSSVVSYISLTGATGDVYDTVLTLFCLPVLFHMKHESIYIYTLLSSYIILILLFVVF